MKRLLCVGTMVMCAIACSTSTTIEPQVQESFDGGIIEFIDSGPIQELDANVIDGGEKHDSGSDSGKKDSGTCPTGDVSCGSGCMPSQPNNSCCANLGVDGYCSNNNQCNSDGSCGLCDKVCEQESIDYNVSITLLNLTIDLWNTYIVNQPWTNNITGICPLGGTVEISGTISIVPYQVAPNVTEGNVTTVNLQFTFTSCELLDQGNTLTFSGSISEIGYWNSGTNVTNVNYESDSMSINGSEDDSGVNDTACSIMIADSSLANPEISGKICNRIF